MQQFTVNPAIKWLEDDIKYVRKLGIGVSHAAPLFSFKDDHTELCRCEVDGSFYTSDSADSASQGLDAYRLDDDEIDYINDRLDKMTFCSPLMRSML